MRLGTASCLIGLVLCTVQTRADELPSRKPGAWEVRQVIGTAKTSPLVVKQCIDAATDHLLQSSTGPYSADLCPRRSVQKSAEGMTIDSTCTIAGKTAKTHAVIAGSFDSAYKMTVTSQGEGVPGSDITLSLEAKWLGPCATDQKPGDLVMGNGMKLNILDAQKQGAGSTPPTR
jgi:Protein of unknown function (DUF3617)